MIAESSVASFRLRRFVVWSLPPTHVAKEERDDGDQLQRGSFPSRYYSDGCPLVCRLPLEHAPRRRTHAGTWGPRGSLDYQPVGGQIQPAAGGTLSPPQATGVDQLADGSVPDATCKNALVPPQALGVEAVPPEGWSQKGAGNAHPLLLP